MGRVEVSRRARHIYRDDRRDGLTRASQAVRPRSEGRKALINAKQAVRDEWSEVGGGGVAAVRVGRPQPQLSASPSSMSLSDWNRRRLLTISAAAAAEE